VAGLNSVVARVNALRAKVEAFGHTAQSKEVRAVALESDTASELVVIDLAVVMRGHGCDGGETAVAFAQLANAGQLRSTVDQNVLL
jgi:hypothetical protein